jgi:hypothetical protein
MCDWRLLWLHYCWLPHMLKRKRRSIAFPASALITQAGAEALRRRINPYRLGLAFALPTRKLVVA